MIFLFLINSNIFSQENNEYIFENEIPVLLQGIWQNNHRMISFEQKESAQIVLKLFYGWYYDRVAEPAEIELPRPRNDATSVKSQIIQVSFESIIEPSETSGAWNLVLYYTDFKQSVKIPIAVFDKKLYTDFFIVRQINENELILQAASNVSDITVNIPCVNENVYSYFKNENIFYKIRYWLTDMNYDSDSIVTFEKNDFTGEVSKHLFIGKSVYTCVPGRSTKIRNIEFADFNAENIVFSLDNRICTLSEAYLVQTNESDTDFYKDVIEANKRRRPPPKPPLPRPEVDFYYDEIRELRKNLPIFSIDKSQK